MFIILYIKKINVLEVCLRKKREKVLKRWFRFFDEFRFLKLKLNFEIWLYSVLGCIFICLYIIVLFGDIWCDKNLKW